MRHPIFCSMPSRPAGPVVGSRFTVLVVAATLCLPGALTFADDESAPGVHPEVELTRHDLLDAAADLPSADQPGGSVDGIETRFRMPLLSHDWWSTTVYVDLDPGAGILDYECNVVTYNGHTGNDFALRDFVEQDEGRFVVAAAPGTVFSTDDGHFDRNTSIVPDTPPNYVSVDHEDGSRSYYLHLRKWSVEVSPGQEVREGQRLGLVGSSGESNGPHLHFAVLHDGTTHEPHAGPCRPGDSLWQEQAPHVFGNPFALVDAGMTTVNPVGDYPFRPPDVHHVTQQPGGTTHYAWFSVRFCHADDTIRTLYRDPLGAVFKDVSTPCGQWFALVHGKWTTGLPETGSLGTWTIEHRLNEVTQSLQSFLYDAVPASTPVASGRTIVVTHGSAGGDLRGSDADSGLAEFRIVAPPTRGRVALHGPRQRYFTYTPNSGFQGLDAFTFEVEDGQEQVSAPATIFLNVAPVVANVARLEGDDDHVSVADNGSLNLTDALTLEAWVRRAPGSADWNVIFDRRNPSNATGFSFGIQNDSRLRFGLGDGVAGTFAYSATPIPIGRWIHVAATWDGATMRVFVDGVADGAPVSFAGTVSYPGTYPTLLGRSQTPGNSFRGDVDELRIWAVARSAPELRAGATCAFAASPPPPGLRGWWRFAGNADDESGEGNHGTLVGDVFFRRTAVPLPLCSSQDSDGDGHDDATDVCPFSPDPGQLDTDGDGPGDACDLCPALSASRQFDSDGDGVGDACDACPFLVDTDQLDSDSDGAGDVCDPDPATPASARPAAIGDVVLAHDPASGSTTMSWTASPHATEYQVVRGSLEEIRDRFYGTCDASADANPSDTTFVDSDSPPSGELRGYLVVGIAPGGSHGLAGLDSNGRERDLRAKDCS